MEYVAFYRGERATTHGGHTIDAVLAFTENKLECGHTFIQWLFPMKAPSRAQPDAAPHAFTDQAIRAMQHDTDVMIKVERATRMMLKHWGMCWELNTERFVFIENETKYHQRLGDGDHNQLRMTRVLVCLRSLGYNGLVEGIQSVLYQNAPGCPWGLAHWLEV